MNDVAMAAGRLKSGGGPLDFSSLQSCQYKDFPILASSEKRMAKTCPRHCFFFLLLLWSFSIFLEIKGNRQKERAMRKALCYSHIERTRSITETR